jgi:hypothetical protein
MPMTIFVCNGLTEQLQCFQIVDMLDDTLSCPVGGGGGGRPWSANDIVIVTATRLRA